MPLDPSIPLRTTTVDPSPGINALAGAFKYREQQQERQEDRAMRREEFAANQELRKIQMANEKFKQMDAREQRRLKSTILGAAQLNTFLDANDTEGAKNFLQTRRGQILQAKEIDPSFDTNETDQLLGMVHSGDVEGLKKVTQNSIKLGQALGVLQKPEKDAGFTLGEGQMRYDSTGKLVASVAPKSKLLTPEEMAQQKEIRAAGKTSISQPIYMPGSLTPAKPTQGKIDEALMESGGRLMRLDNIAASFKPEYQTFSTQMGSRWSALKERSGVGLSASETKALTDFSKFKAGALSNLNLYIKEITGAAMSEVEADRIRQAMPDPGSGLLDGDSPTQFKAKLDDSIRLVKMAEARNVYLKRNGMSLTNEKGDAIIPLDKMPTLINQRGKEIEAQLKKAQPGVDAKALKRAVVRQLGQEFGLASD